MNCHRASPTMRHQSGAALVVAMLVFALCTALIVAMKSEFNRFYQRGANLFHSEQGYAYLRGAEDLAGLALLADHDLDKEQKTPRDHLGELWAQPTTPYALDEGGWLVGSLKDLQGRFNLNSLAAKAGGGGTAGGSREERFSAAQQQFIRLLQSLEEVSVSEQDAIMITQSVSDWLDTDGEPAPDGAEDDYYFSLTPAYRAGNAPMASVSELRSVAYMTPEIFAALRTLVSVWPQQPGTLNILTASAAVLRSINSDGNLSPLSEADAQSLVDYRENTGFKDVAEFLANPVFSAEPQEMAGVKALLGERSSYFLLEAEVEVADRKMRLYSVLERKRRQISALARASGSL